MRRLGAIAARWKRWIAWAGIAIAALPLAGIAAFFAAVQWVPALADSTDPGASTFVLDRQGVALAALVSSDGQWRLPLSGEQVSGHLLRAIVAVEDSRFYRHHGVDWKSVAAAAWTDLTHFRVMRGASTITMQVDHLRRPAPRSFANKLMQAIRAEQLEGRRNKSEILVEYVNRAPFGGNLCGAGAASWRYFGKPCKELSLGQAALLAGLPQSPNRLRPDRFPQRAKVRRDHVLDRMLECGFITPIERIDAASEPINASWRPLPQERFAAQVPAADGALPTLLKLAADRVGRNISTTIDSTVQRQAMSAALEQLNALSSSGVNSGAVVVLDNRNSQCLAAVSIGADELRIDLTRRARSTGSVLKPFIYAAAFDAGICAPGTVLADRVASWAGYEPSDYDRSFRGPMTAAEALAESRNIPAMMVLARVGVESAIGTMDAAGLHGLARSPKRYGLTLAIGGAEASPMEVALAYAALARGGESSPVRFTDDGPAPQARVGRFIRSGACWQVLAAVSDVAWTRMVCPEAARSHVAWKTGTSSGHRDAWCAAVTRRFTVVVWLGNPKGESSPVLVGQEAAAPVALRLISVLDPVDEAWPLVLGFTEKVAWHGAKAGAELAIRSPDSGQEVVLESDVPRERQRVSLQAGRTGSRGTDEAGRLWWFVDDKPVGASRESERVWWEPTPGMHEIRVVDEAAGSAVMRVNVRSY